MTDLFDGPHLPPPDPAKLAELLSRLNISKAILSGRLDRHWSQEDLARAASTTQARISRLEAMKENASLDTLDRVAKALGLTIALVPIVPLPPGDGNQV